MRNSLVIPLVAAAMLATGCQREGRVADWEKSVVSIRATRYKYDYSQPWVRETANTDKVGVVIDGETILTTAEHLSDRTLVTVRREGRGKWWPAEVKWIDYHANLALVGSGEAGFWAGLESARLAADVPDSGEVTVRRWRDGRLEDAKGEITDVRSRRSQLSHVHHLALEVKADVEGAGWGEVVTRGGEVVGIASSSYEKSMNAITSTFASQMIAAARDGEYRGLGLFTFEWQPGRNPDTLAHLRAADAESGIIVTRVPGYPEPEKALRPRDVILEIDGLRVSPEGDYRDPRYGFLSVEFLADRGRWAGDTLPMKIVRDGAVADIEYRLPAASYGIDLVPLETFDRAPEYLIVGGLVFQPLTEPLMRSMGRSAPIRFACYRDELPTADKPSVVFLNQVLPDPINVDYHDLRFEPLERVNGRPIRVLKDIIDAVASPMGDVHLFEFTRGLGLNRIVLDARGLPAADARILKRYGIQSALELGP
jgi:hypothetical protein